MEPLDIRRLAVLGAGTMGNGIAQIAARAGLETILFDVDAGALLRGMERVAEGLAKAVQKGKLAAAELEATKARVRGERDLATAVSHADLVVESAPEDLALKKQIFAQVSTLVRPDALVATNTSSLPVTEIASAATHPERVVGLHFFNPPAAMALVEIVRGERTSPETVALARAVAERLGKQVVVVRDSAGFATSRLGIALALEAMRMLEEGVASAEEIDRALVMGYGHPMGPLALTDQVGLDVRLAVADHLAHELGERFRPPQVLRRLVRAGKLGRKTGEGFYRY